MAITYTLSIHFEKECGAEIIVQYEQEDLPESATILTQISEHILKTDLSNICTGQDFLNKLDDLLKECYFTESCEIEYGIDGETPDQRMNTFRDIDLSDICMIHFFESVCYYDQESAYSEMHYDCHSKEFASCNQSGDIEAVYITCQSCGCDYPIIAPEEEWKDLEDGLPAEFGFPSLSEQERAVIEHSLCPQCLKRVGLI